MIAAMSVASETLAASADLPIDPRARRLTVAEQAQFEASGYVKNLPVFDAGAVPVLQAKFHELAALQPADVDINKTNNWHKANRWYHDLCRTPAILDYVEDLLGGDFFQWGGQFFVKYPGDGSVVPWHQDAQYWPLSPRKTITVWLAVYDADEENAAMQVVRGSHRGGVLRHHAVDGPEYVLEQEADAGQIDPDSIVTFDLKAGEISLHDDGLLHGSGPNRSDRLRCAITMRFCPTEVQGDLRVWPTFEVMMARGIDRHGHNPVAKIPTGNGFPVRRFQPSSDFA